MNSNKRLARLEKLRSVVEMHEKAQGEPVQLNGVSKRWDMDTWCCNTSACALGSYALTPHGRRAFRLVKPHDSDTPHYELEGKYGSEGLTATARHFGITRKEATWLFLPERYPDEDDIQPSEVLCRIDDLIDKYSQ